MSESIDCFSDRPKFLKKVRSQEQLTNLNKKLKTGEDCTKIQNVKCLDVANKFNDLDMCRDCSLSLDKDENLDDDECRFNGWRRLKFFNFDASDFQCDFLQESDSSEKDWSIWDLNDDHPKITAEDSEEILSFIGEKFDKLLEKENKFRQNFEKNGTWKRKVMHSRELCDQCSTTIFNGHMACQSCGFVVCIDCFELRGRDLKFNSKLFDSCCDLIFELYLKERDKSNNKDQFLWLYCYKFDFKFNKLIKKMHFPNELIYVQFIPSNILTKIYSKYKNCRTLVHKKSRALTCSNQLKSSYLIIDLFVENSRIDDDEVTEIFAKEWLSKKPVVVKNLHQSLDEKLWTADSFSSEFGHLEIDLVNCKNSRIVPSVLLEKFWSGFDNSEERLCDHKGKKMILKLKDWPSSDDFKNFLPSRYEDLMKNLPFKKFTQRNGIFNLVSYLPDFFCLPDLGPKLYIAYSSAATPKEGTTNLHVDISDAVNVMVYVSDFSSHSEKNNSSEKELFQVLQESNCSQEHIDRYLNNEKPGALWHIFRPSDADNIRTCLTLKDINKGRQIVDINDPIHDQTNYLDNRMLEQLKNEYDVEVFTIVQFLGDAIFIPSGAPHQVRNLNSCIKVAGDFVTPQGIDECLLITDQVRQLSETHNNHEDKLQVKNIIYHGVKTCLSVLNENHNVSSEPQSSHH